jgi:hypothetical protein
MYRNPRTAKSRCFSALPGVRQGRHTSGPRQLELVRQGYGMKAHDMYVAALCPECHYALDQGKDMQKWEREELWLRAWRKTIYELFERGLSRCTF